MKILGRNHVTLGPKIRANYKPNSGERLSLFFRCDERRRKVVAQVCRKNELLPPFDALLNT